MPLDAVGLKELRDDAGTAIGGQEAQRRAVRFALAHERQDVADGLGPFEGDEAAVGEEFAAEADVVGAEGRFALAAEHIFLELHERGEIVSRERSDLVSAHGQLLVELPCKCSDGA